MLDVIRRELEKYEGTWTLPDDLDALMEIIARAWGGEWIPVGAPKVEYTLTKAEKLDG